METANHDPHDREKLADIQDPHNTIAYGALEGLVHDRKLETTEDKIDDLEEIITLEQKAQAFKFISTSYALSDLAPLERALAPLNRPMHSVSHIGNQFATKIIPCYLAGSPDEGWRLFESIPAHTTDEELVLLTNKKQFFDVYEKLQEHLAIHTPEYRQSATERLSKSRSSNNPNQGSITWNDKYQFNGNETKRSLENMLKHGVSISMDPNGIDQLRAAYEIADGGILPITELIKNKEVLGVNGFMGSKIALAVHDSIDHVLGFKIASDTGLIDKYAMLWESIGNPCYTDIFKREGESLASIGFGVRYWANQEHGFTPLINVSDLLNYMDLLFDKGKLTHTHMDAFKLLRELAKTPSSRESQSLGFVFSNYVVELDEQKRKHGKIKYKDLSTKKIVGELNPYDPDYLCFFIEMHHELLQSPNKHRDTLLRYHLLLEEYLCAIASGVITENNKLHIQIQDLNKIDFSKTTLPPARIQWMTRNYGFSAIRDAIL